MVGSSRTFGLSKDRVYDLKTATRIIGVSIGTFRKYPSRGLRVIDDSRPMLVRGADLISFLDAQAKARKRPGKLGQLYCVRCDAQRDMMGGMADYIPRNDNTGRLVAYCGTCEAQCSSFSSPAKVLSLAGVLDIRLADVS